MKKNQLKSLIKFIIKEIIEKIHSKSLNENQTVNVKNNKEFYWKDHKNFEEWLKNNVKKDGTYYGEPLDDYGFAYRVGEKIPLNKIYLLSAFYMWQTAKRHKDKDIHEQSTTGAVVGYSSPYSFRKKIKEMSVSGNVTGYLTPYAFSKKERDNKATSIMKKMGFKVSDKSRRDL